MEKIKTPVPTIKYIAATADDRDTVCEFCKNTADGTELYSRFLFDISSIEHSQVWKAVDGNGELIACIYELNGDTVVAAASTANGALARENFFSPVNNGTADRHTVKMTFESGTLPENLIKLSRNAKQLKADELYGLSLFLSGSPKLGFEESEIYIKRKKAVNAGAAFYFAVKKNGNIVSSAGIVATNKNFALIGDVYTAKSERGQSFASSCVAACTGKALSMGLIPFLYCEEKNIGFYKKLNFTEGDYHDGKL